MFRPWELSNQIKTYILTRRACHSIPNPETAWLHWYIRSHLMTLLHAPTFDVQRYHESCEGRDT
jgi:hypothetical protein